MYLQMTFKQVKKKTSLRQQNILILVTRSVYSISIKCIYSMFYSPLLWSWAIVKHV